MIGSLGLLVLTIGSTADLGPPEGADRPDWAQREPWTQGDEWFLAVAGPFWPSRQRALAEAVAEAGRRLSQTDFPWSTPYIRRVLAQGPAVERLIWQKFLETRHRDYGTLHRAHLLVRIGPAERRQIEQWAEALRREESGRWIVRAVLMGMVVLAVGVGASRLDRATQRRRSGPVRLAAALLLGAGAYGIWQLV